MSGNRRAFVRRRAVTYIEIVMVALILGIAGAVAAPRFARSYAHLQANAAAQRIVTDLQFARRQARITATAGSVFFRPSDDRYWMSGIADPERPGKSYVVNMKQTGYPADLTSAKFGDQTWVIFDIFGRPSRGGNVTLRVGSLVRTIMVEASSGQISWK